MKNTSLIINQISLSISSLCMAFALIFLANCKGKDGEPGKDGAGVLGNMRGKVSLLDEYGSQLKYSNGFVDNSGVSVSIAKLGLSTTTAVDGSFSFLNIPNGTQDATFSYPGYSPVSSQTIVLGDFPFTTNSYDYTFSYFPISSSQLRSKMGIKYGFGSSVIFGCVISNYNKSYDSLRTITIFIGHDAQVSADNYDWVSNSNRHTIVTDSSFAYLSFSELYALGYQKGKNTKCYAIAYGSSYSSFYHRVFASTSQKYIYPYLSPSKTEVVSFVLP